MPLIPPPLIEALKEVIGYEEGQERQIASNRLCCRRDSARRLRAASHDASGDTYAERAPVAHDSGAIADSRGPNGYLNSGLDRRAQSAAYLDALERHGACLRLLREARGGG